MSNYVSTTLGHLPSYCWIVTLFSLWLWVCVFRDSRYTTLICPFHHLTILFSNSCCFPPFFFYHYLSIFDLLPTANNWYNREALDTLPKTIFHSYLWYFNSPLLAPRSYRVSAALHMTTCHFPRQYVLSYWHAKTTSVSQPCSRFLSTHVIRCFAMRVAMDPVSC